jgi:programmed cell death 6-interacting protein
MSTQYESTIKMASASDATVRTKWTEWKSRIEILAGGEVSPFRLSDIELTGQDYLNDHIPTTTTSSSSTSYSSLPPSVRPLRASLEELDDTIAHRARIISECRQISAADDVRPQVLKEASRLAHGGTGDVKTEWFEEIFGKSMEKYERLREEIEGEARKQDDLLERIRVSFLLFCNIIRSDDPPTLQVHAADEPDPE